VKPCKVVPTAGTPNIGCCRQTLSHPNLSHSLTVFDCHWRKICDERLHFLTKIPWPVESTSSAKQPVWTACTSCAKNGEELLLCFRRSIKKSMWQLQGNTAKNDTAKNKPCKEQHFVTMSSFRLPCKLLPYMVLQHLAQSGHGCMERTQRYT